MAFKEGQQKKGGRQKGTGNKTTAQAQELFVGILQGQSSKVEDALNEVYKTDKAKFLELYAKYAQYFVPKKIEQHNTHEIPDTIQIKLK